MGLPGQPSLLSITGEAGVVEPLEAGEADALHLTRMREGHHHRVPSEGWRLWGTWKIPSPINSTNSTTLMALDKKMKAGTMRLATALPKMRWKTRMAGLSPADPECL